MKLTVHTFLSMDGVMQGPGGVEEDPSGGFDRGGWLVPFVDDDFSSIVDGWFEQADEFLFGRSTYDLMAGYWPEVTEPDNRVATLLNGCPKHVVSRTLQNPSWANTTVLPGDVVDAVSALKSRPGRELQVHGSSQLAQTLHNAGLVDEYRLLIFPVVLGVGKRLFPEGSRPTSFSRTSGGVTSTGVTHQVLRPTEFRTGGLSVEDGRERLDVAP